MPEDLEALRKRIEEGVEAAEQMQRILQERERGARGEAKKRFRLIKGGLIGAGIWAGVEWFRDYKRITLALVAASITVGGAVIAEHPGSPGADPPDAIKPPASTRPSLPPPKRPKPTPAPTPQRTSPPRTQMPMRITPPPAAPSSTAAPPKTKEPSRVPTRSPTPTSEPPTSTPTVSLPVTPTVSITTTPDSCTINLLGIRVCLPLG